MDLGTLQGVEMRKEAPLASSVWKAKGHGSDRVTIGGFVCSSVFICSLVGVVWNKHIKSAFSKDYPGNVVGAGLEKEKLVRAFLSMSVHFLLISSLAVEIQGCERTRSYGLVYP